MARVIAAVAALAMSAPALAQTTDAPLSTMNSAEEGQYLVDGSHQALYTFKADTQGRGGTPPASACNDDACVGTWPPLLVSEAPVGDGTLESSMLATLTRADGSLQVTYNGWPLYYYYEDSGPGDIKGDDIESFGEDWYLIGPHGARPGKAADD